MAWVVFSKEGGVTSTVGRWLARIIVVAWVGGFIIISSFERNKTGEALSAWTALAAAAFFTLVLIIKLLKWVDKAL